MLLAFVWWAVGLPGFMQPNTCARPCLPHGSTYWMHFPRPLVRRRGVHATSPPHCLTCDRPGLVRSGVAPDHPEVKACQAEFTRVACSANVSFLGNVTLGADVSVQELQSLYDAVLVATGAQVRRRRLRLHRPEPKA